MTFWNGLFDYLRGIFFCSVYECVEWTNGRQYPYATKMMPLKGVKSRIQISADAWL